MNLMLEPEFRAYLADLEMRLRHVDETTRTEVLAGVREHIESAVAGLGREPTGADRRAIVDSLGDPAAIVAATGRPPGLPADVATGATLPLLARSWLPVVVLALQLIGMPFGIFAVPVVFLLAGLVLLVISPLYRGWEKVWSVLSSLAGLVGGLMIFGVGLDGMDGCYDRATGEGVDPATGQPIEGIRPCSAETELSDMLVSMGGLWLLGCACITAVVFAVIALHRSRHPSTILRSQP